jgi:hypothetical protein
MTYLGNTPTTQSFISGTDYFNGTGAQTAFTLSRTVASINDIQVTVNNVVQQPNDAYTISGTTLTMTSAPSSGTNNVYVRYLSTTTQAITPSQGTVSWSTLDSNIQQDLGVMFKNRIINGNMVIDQRNDGGTVTPANSAYTVDRWFAVGSQPSKYNVQQNAGSVTPPAGFTNYLGVTSTSAYTVTSSDYFAVYQVIEGYNCADLNWGSANAQTITLSFWVRSSLTGAFGASVFNNAATRFYAFNYTISAANTWTKISVTIPGDQSGTWLTTNGGGIFVYFGLGIGSAYAGTANVWGGQAYAPTSNVSVVGTNGATWYMTGCQLEVGTQATTFTTAGGSYGAEFQLCMRYYYKLLMNEFGAINGFCDNSTNGIFFYQFPVPMRTSPTLGTTGSASNYGIRQPVSGLVSCNAVPAIIGTASVGVARIQGYTAGSLTTYSGAGLTSDGASTFLAFAAEL